VNNHRSTPLKRRDTGRSDRERVQRAIVILLVVSLLSAGYYFFTVFQSATVRSPAPPATIASSPQHAARSSEETAVPVPRADVRRGTEKNQTNLISVRDLVSKLGPRPSRFDVLDNASAWIARAKAGDTLAAFAVHDAATNCLRFADDIDARPRAVAAPDGFRLSSDCPKMPRAVAQDRLGLFGPAAAQGSVFARLAYGVEVARLSVAHDAIGRGTAMNAGDKEQALAYIEDAARHGVREAYYELYFAYDRGAFGARDESKAASYLLALRALDPQASSSATSKSYLENMRPADRQRAEEMAKTLAASCCLEVK
jgi:hypothetical protein